MDKSKLVEFMKALSKQEMKEFGKYLEGTSYRSTGKVVALYNYLSKLYPEFPVKKIEKEYVSKKVLKEVDKSSRKLLDLMTNLFSVLEDFLIKKELETNLTERNFLLLESMKKRKLDKFFFQKITLIEKDWEKKTMPGIEHLYDEYKLTKLCLFHPNYENFLKNNLNLSDLVEKIDRFYLSRKLYSLLFIFQQSSFVTNNLSEVQEDPKFLMKEIESICNLPHFQKMPQIKLLWELLLGYKNNKFENFDRIKQDFTENLDLFNETESRDLITIFVQICMSKYSNGEIKYLREVYELYKLSVEKMLIFEQGYIAGQSFINISDIGCSVNELDWVDQFINEKGSYLKEEHRQDIIDLCQIKLGMKRRQFDLVLEKLSIIKFLNPYFAIQAKAIQLQCYYELGEDYYELFLNQVKSFQAFLSRKDEIGAQIKIALKNFISCTKELQKISTDSGGNPEELKEKILASKNLACKSWLSEKVDELSIKR